jgi:putative inorganic carbon (hco3(-)) transporter
MLKKWYTLSEQQQFIIYILLALIFFISLTFLPIPYHSYDAQRIGQLILLTLISLTTLCIPHLRQYWLECFFSLAKTIRYALAIILLCAIFSAWQAKIPHYAFLELSLYSLLFICAIYLAAIMRQKSTQFMLFFLAIIVAFAIIYLEKFFIHIMVLAQGLSDFSAVRATGLFPVFSNVRFFGQIQTWTLPVIVLPFLLVKRQDKILRFLFFMLASLWWMLVFVADARSSLVIAVVLGISLPLFYGKAIIVWASVQLSAMLTGYGLYWIIFKKILLSNGLMALDRLAHLDNPRIWLWQKAWHLFRTHPWLGCGPMHFSYQANQMGAHPHNTIFLLLSELGIIVTSVVILITIWGMTKWIQHCRRFLRQSQLYFLQQLHIALTASLLAGLTHSMTSGIAIMPISQLLLVSVFACCYGLYRQHNSTLAPTVTFARKICISIFILGTLFTLAWSLQDDLSPIKRAHSLQLNYPGSYMRPRFWQQGWISPP